MKLSIDPFISQNFLTSYSSGKRIQIKYEFSLKPEKRKHYKYWTLDDDQRLSELAKESEYDWKKISKAFPSRTAADVEQRWRQRIDPSTKKTAWTKEEDHILNVLHKKFGGKWKMIAQYLPGRLPSSIKNRFYGKIFKRNGKHALGIQQESNLLLDEKDENFIESFLHLTDDESECTDRDSCIRMQI